MAHQNEELLRVTAEANRAQRELWSSGEGVHQYLQQRERRRERGDP